MKKRITVFGLLRLEQWRVVPWYESWSCDKGCCFTWRFTWVFFRIEQHSTTN